MLFSSMALSIKRDIAFDISDIVDSYPSIKWIYHLSIHFNNALNPSLYRYLF